MRLLVTGIHGWIASAFADYSRMLGHDVTGSSRIIEQGVVQIPLINGETDWSVALSGCDVVVHLAARAHVMRDSEREPLAVYRAVNTAGTLNLARQAAASGVKRFVFVSSVKVHGEKNLAAHPFREDDLLAPVDAYGISKREAEDGLKALARKTTMEIVIIRPPLVYGPGVKGNFHLMLDWVARGIPLPLGAIHNVRSLVALDNLVDFISLCADPERSPKAANQTFLISDGEDVSTTELLIKIGKALGTRPRLLSVPPWLIRLVARFLGQSAMIERLLASLVVDGSKAREMLGWQPVVTMESQLEKMTVHAAIT